MRRITTLFDEMSSDNLSSIDEVKIGVEGGGMGEARQWSGEVEY